MKTLLVNPPKYWNGMYVCREENGIGIANTDYLPSQIFLAAAYLRETGKYADPVDVENQDISFDNYDVVVVWVCILHTFYEDIRWLKRAKEEGKKTIMILNDAHEGLEVEAMEKYDFIDVSVRLWERETVLEKVISAWEENKPLDFPGIIYRRDGQVIDTGRMEFSPDLEHLPSCSDLLKQIPPGKYPAAAITTGRGCPMPHRFCLYSRSRLRRRKIQDVVSEFEVVSSRVNKVLIMDPAMPVTTQWFEELCDELVARNIKVSWRTDLHLERCTPERLRKMKKAGCSTIMFLVPTMDTTIKERIGGGYTHQELKTAIQNIRREGIVPMPVFDIGWPWDNHQSLSKIMTFLRQTPLPWFSIRQVRPWKGTSLYEDCKELGLLKRDLCIDDYVHSGYPILNTLYLSREEIGEWKSRILRTHVLNPRYFLRFFMEGRRIEAKHFGQFLKLVFGKDAVREKRGR